jgi:hypothetical protein
MGREKVENNEELGMRNEEFFDGLWLNCSQRERLSATGNAKSP